MIYESWPWKQELYKYRKLLDKCSQQKRITEKAYTQIEKSIFFSAFIIRKLIDCTTKVSDEVDGYAFHLKAIKPLRNIDRLHRWADYEDYDWDHQLLMTASGKDICNWLIHSYISSLLGMLIAKIVSSMFVLILIETSFFTKLISLTG